MFGGLLAMVSVTVVAVPTSVVAVPEPHRWLTFTLFAAIVGLSMMVTHLAAKRVKTPDDFYTAGRSISGMQNGWAIAGDYLSAASFLGVTGLISLWGFDGFMYSVGWLLAYLVVLLLIAEPCRNIGKYTLADILAYRNDPRTSRIIGALSVMIVSTIYLVAQMVAGGVLVKALVGINYEVSVIAVGLVMLAYVVLGGMVATTWVQIVKAVLLMGVSLIMVLLLWHEYGFFGDFFAEVAGNARVQNHVATILGHSASDMSPAALGQRFLEPGLLFENPLDQISLALALVFGIIGLPHILMRFFTVPTARAARTSVAWAMAIIGSFYVLTIFLGLGAAMKVGISTIIDHDAGGNMAAPLLAQALGGGAESMLGNFMLALVAAAAFSTIVAVVAALVLAVTSALAHDLYAGVWRQGKLDTKSQVRAARLTAIVFGVLAIFLGMAAKGQNVAHLVALAFALAASANCPCVLLTLFWRRCNTGGIVAGMVVGSVFAIGLVLVSPNMSYPLAIKAEAERVLLEAPGKLRRIEADLASENGDTVIEAKRARATLGKAVMQAKSDLARYRNDRTSIVGLEEPLFKWRNPALISLPLGFLAVILGSLVYHDPRALKIWDELYVRRHTGILAGRLERR
ncbi:MAG: cation acetate symporter [Zoogloeaceae bacterium]|nr:cation acetate symporter [Zoogloeaceae bacterium]